MTRPGLLALWVVFSAGACNREPRSPARTESARGEVTPVRVDTGMAGMDHSMMPGMPGMTAKDTPTTDKTAMAGMDHSKMQMPGMADMKSRAAPNGKSDMAGMDHSKMPGMGNSKAASSSGNMAGMSHAKMPGMTAARHTNMGGASMGNMNMSAATAERSTGELKLDQLVAALLRDSVVWQRIRSDTALQRRWDAAAQQLILANP